MNDTILLAKLDDREARLKALVDTCRKLWPRLDDEVAFFSDCGKSTSDLAKIADQLRRATDEAERIAL